MSTSSMGTDSSLQNPVPGDTFKQDCVFCRIAYKKAPIGDKAVHVYTDEDYVAFRDHRPAGKNHFLVIPRAHYKGSVKRLNREDIPMIRRMEEIGKQLLSKHECEEAPLNDQMLGFHWPIVTVNHLHLHAISPTNRMSLIQKCEYSSWVFGTVQQAVDLISKRGK